MRVTCGTCLHWLRGGSSDAAIPLPADFAQAGRDGVCQLLPPERHGQQWLQPITDQSRSCSEWSWESTDPIDGDDPGPDGGERAPTNVHPFPVSERTAA